MFRIPRIKVRIIAGAALLAAFAWAPIIPAQQSGRSKNHAKGHAPSAPAPAPMVVPFRMGETLNYRVLFSKFSVNAGQVQASVIERRDFYGQSAWHFRAFAHSVDTIRMLFQIDDQFDSYSSAATLSSLQYEMYLHEQGKDQQSVYRLTTDAEPAPKNATALRVAPGTRDPIDFLYAVRANDWRRSPELRVPVFDGRRLYDVVARVDTAQAAVHVPAGDFSASRIAIRLFDQDKEIADTHLWLSIANDAARTPVLIEAELPFGSFRVELTRLP